MFPLYYWYYFKTLLESGDRFYDDIVSMHGELSSGGAVYESIFAMKAEITYTGKTLKSLAAQLTSFETVFREIDYVKMKTNEINDVVKSLPNTLAFSESNDNLDTSINNINKYIKDLWNILNDWVAKAFETVGGYEKGLTKIANEIATTKESIDNFVKRQEESQQKGINGMNELISKASSVINSGAENLVKIEKAVDATIQSSKNEMKNSVENSEQMIKKYSEELVSEKKRNTFLN